MKNNRDPVVEPFRFDRGKIRVRHLNDERTDGAEWLLESPQRRIEAVELLRAGFSGKQYASQRLSRFLVITRQT